MRVLLKHGADRTIKAKDGNTAAATAKGVGHTELAALIDGAPA